MLLWLSTCSGCEEDLYMRAPPGVNNRGGELVCKLRRSLYGLKQAGREWAQLLSSFLVSWGFVRSTIDVCLYTYEKDGTVLWALVYVDDILLADNCPNLRARFVADISRRFPTEDKGELEWILNTAITRNRAARSLTFRLSQGLYTADLVAKFECSRTSIARARAASTRRLRKASSSLPPISPFSAPSSTTRCPSFAMRTWPSSAGSFGLRI